MAEPPSLFRVLMVCSGNTCRSPLAELALRAVLPAELAEWLDVASCGTGAADGLPASDGARRLARAEGLSLEEHRSRRLSRPLIDEANLVLAMEPAHLDAVLHLDPSRAADVHLLTAYAAGASAREGAPIPDPFGGGLERYRSVYRQIRDAVQAALPRLAESCRRGGAAPPGGAS